jgi:hypothetical protein
MTNVITSPMALIFEILKPELVPFHTWNWEL